jgi:hypothetical protein
LGKNACRHQKVLLSNLGLTAFVKRQVKWLNRFRSLPSGKEKQKTKKTVKRQRPQGLLHFLPLIAATAFSCSLSFHRKYMPHRIYRGTEVYFIRSLHP